jgi:hypothetical protein
MALLTDLRISIWAANCRKWRCCSECLSGFAGWLVLDFEVSIMATLVAEEHGASFVTADTDILLGFM